MMKRKKLVDYVVADTHFGHEFMLKVEPTRALMLKNSSKRNFDDLMIDRWNTQVKDDDHILHLGDVVFKNSPKLTKRLKGDITLLVGNHDSKEHIEFYKSIGWDIIDDLRLLIPKADEYISDIKDNFSQERLSHRYLACLVQDTEDERVMFSHFPVFDDNVYDKKKYKDIVEILEYIFIQTDCTINIHGHTHSRPAKESFCNSACLELNEFNLKRV